MWLFLEVPARCGSLFSTWGSGGWGETAGKVRSSTWFRPRFRTPRSIRFTLQPPDPPINWITIHLIQASLQNSMIHPIHTPLAWSTICLEPESICFNPYCRDKQSSVFIASRQGRWQIFRDRAWVKKLKTGQARGQNLPMTGRGGNSVNQYVSARVSVFL